MSASGMEELLSPAPGSRPEGRIGAAAGPAVLMAALTEGWLRSVVASRAGLDLGRPLLGRPPARAPIRYRIALVGRQLRAYVRR